MATRKLTTSDIETLRQMRKDITSANDWRRDVASGGVIGPPGRGNGSNRISRRPDDGFWAKITGSEQQGDDYAWAYASQEVYKSEKGPGKWTVVPDGITTGSDINGDLPVAWNTLEDMNGESGVMGMGLTLPLAAGPDFEVKPIPNGAIVWMRFVVCADGEVEFHFTVPNAIDGPCPTEESEPSPDEDF